MRLTGILTREHVQFRYSFENLPCSSHGGGAAHGQGHADGFRDLLPACSSGDGCLKMTGVWSLMSMQTAISCFSLA
jgi:hypothetical protein